MTRTAIPTRRHCVTVETLVNGKAATISVGFHPDTGEALEAFADIAKGSDQQHAVSDACVAVSLALQHGMPIATLEKAVGRIPTWTPVQGDMVETEAPASVVGVVVDTIAEVAHGVRHDPDFFKDGER
jgi:hypothetical protein